MTQHQVTLNEHTLQRLLRGDNQLVQLLERILNQVPEAQVGEHLSAERYKRTTFSFPSSRPCISRPSLQRGRLSVTSQSAKAIEQGRWFQLVGVIFINKSQADHTILSDKERGWHRQLP